MFQADNVVVLTQSKVVVACIHAATGLMQERVPGSQWLSVHIPCVSGLAKTAAGEFTLALISAMGFTLTVPDMLGLYEARG
jgi:hypothetical protein